MKNVGAEFRRTYGNGFLDFLYYSIPARNTRKFVYYFKCGKIYCGKFAWEGLTAFVFDQYQERYRDTLQFLKGREDVNN